MIRTEPKLALLSLVALGLLGAALGLHGGCGGGRCRNGELEVSPVEARHRRHDRPSFLIVVFDAARKDALAAYNPALHGRTPVTSRLAEQGVVFDACYTAASYSGPSYASLLTGLYPPSHGVLDHPWELPAENQTIIEVARNAGWYTLFLTQHSYLSQRWAYPQGAHYYQHCPKGWVLTNRFADWLRANGDVPFVAFLALTAPHFPYGLAADPDGIFSRLPAEDRRLDASVGNFDKMFDLSGTGFSAQYVAAQQECYRREVERADRLLGRIVTALETTERLSDTAIIVTADHGEAFGEHGFYFAHDPAVHAPVANVPLIVSWPDRLPRQRIDSVVSLIDVAPTITEWLGAGRLPGVDGHSLAGVLEGRASAMRDRAVFCYSRPLHRYSHSYESLGERYRLPGFAGASVLGAAGRWNLVLQPLPDGSSVEVFDRVEDPLNLSDLWVSKRAETEIRHLLSETERYRQRLLAASSAREDATLTDEQRAALRSLGYLGGDDSREPQDAPSPHDGRSTSPAANTPESPPP